MDKAKMDRISELTRISRERALTDAEQAERAELRREYIDAVRRSLESELEHTFIVDEDGTKRPLPKK